MKSKDWKEEFEGRFVETYGRKNRKEWSLAYQPYEGLKELEDFISTLLEEARKEGFDDGVKRTVDVVQKGLDELLLERGGDKYWVGDILRDCGSSVEKLLPKEMKHYSSKLTTK